MSKLILPVILLLCLGCRTGTEIRSADQAKDRAIYLKAEAAGLEKRAREAERAIELLQERLETERQYLKLYRERVRESTQDMAEIEQRRGLGGAERRAAEHRIGVLRSEREAMLAKVDEKQRLISKIQEDIQRQRSYREQMLEEAEATLREAGKMEELAAQLATK